MGNYSETEFGLGLCIVTNVIFFVNRILRHPLGCVGINLSTYVKRNSNKAVIGLEKDHHSAVYRNNMCLCRRLALHLGREAAALYGEHSDKDVYDFTGVTLDDLHRVETEFKTNVCVYKLVKTLEETTTAELIRRSLCHYPGTMYMSLYETHYSYIQDIGMYCQSYRCRKCGDSLWKRTKAPWKRTKVSMRCVPAVAVGLSTSGRRGLRCYRRFEILSVPSHV